MSAGTNCPIKTHPLAFKYGYRYPFRHSELDCITKFPKRLSFLPECTLVNIRLGRHNNILLSRPCKDCQRVLISLGMNRIFYTNEYNKLEELKL